MRWRTPHSDPLTHLPASETCAAEIAIERRGRRRKKRRRWMRGERSSTRPGAAVRPGNVSDSLRPNDSLFLLHVDSPSPPPILSRGKEKNEKKVKSAVVGPSTYLPSLPPGGKYRCRVPSTGRNGPVVR